MSCWVLTNVMNYGEWMLRTSKFMLLWFHWFVLLSSTVESAHYQCLVLLYICRNLIFHITLMRGSWKWQWQPGESGRGHRSGSSFRRGNGRGRGHKTGQRRSHGRMRRVVIETQCSDKIQILMHSVIVRFSVIYIF